MYYESQVQDHSLLEALINRPRYVARGFKPVLFVLVFRMILVSLHAVLAPNRRAGMSSDAKRWRR